jgi:endo-1,4-beta-xylanase
MNTTRRKFIARTAAASTLALAVRTPWLEAAVAAPARFTIRGYNRNGDPLSTGIMGSIFLFEASGDRNPLPNPPREVTAGRVVTDAPKAPFGFSVMMPVEGFGTVRLYADNNGKGYASGAEVNLNFELAKSRHAAVTAFLEAARRGGAKITKTISDRLETAHALLTTAGLASVDLRSTTPQAMDSLRESVWAGEEVVFEKSRQAIAKRGKRKGFLFGCNFFGYPGQGEPYAEKFAGLFNFATLPFYWASFEPEKGQPGFARVDTMLARLEKSGLTAKGHPLAWFHEAGCPKWLEGKPFEDWRAEQQRRITEIVTRYKGRIKVYDVINEAHDWGNVPQFTSEQLVEMTRVAADATRAADPKALRVVNNCCLFAEYVAGGATYRGKQPRPLHSPLQYLRAAAKAGVKYDAIGLQVYYPEHDLFEIARMFDRFAALGKPLHVTELGVCSRADTDDKSMVKNPTGNHWHAPWSETVQADWIEQFYTLCYAHPAVQAVTWWDFSDAGGHFWPHGGFLRPDLQPKESYLRLQQLIRGWSKS